MNDAIYAFIYPIVIFIILIGKLRCFNIFSMVILDDNLRINSVCNYILENRIKGLFHILLIFGLIILTNLSFFCVSLLIIYSSKISDDRQLNIFLSICLHSGFVIIYILLHCCVDTDYEEYDDNDSDASSVTLESENV